ncbi:hypothetical protein Bca101_043388 [Brassica carinata]
MLRQGDVFKPLNLNTCKRWHALFRDPRFVEKNKSLGKAVRESMLVTSDMIYSIAGDLYSSGFDTPVQLTGYSRCSSSGHSYKILRYWYYENDQKEWIAVCKIYDLSYDSWRVHDSLPLDHSIYFSGMSLKGDTYWVAADDETPLFLMKFDFTAERLVRIHLPFHSIGSGDIETLSVVKDEKLSVLQINEKSRVMRIWVSNKIDDDEAKDFSWRSYLVLEMDSAEFHLPSVESFLLNEENKVAVCCGSRHTGDGDRTIVYIVGEDMYEQVYEDTTKPYHRNVPAVLTYLPSLVLIQPKSHKRRRLSDT